MMIKKYVFGNPYETGATVLPVEPAGGIPERFCFAAETNGMYMMPLWFAYREDERCREVEDQLLVGDALMIAPVYEQNKTGRYVYLPESMRMLRFRAYDDYDSEVLPAGDHYVEAALNEVLVFLRLGCELPLATPARHVEQIDEKQLTRIAFAKL